MEERETVFVERSGIPTLVYRDEMRAGETVYVEKKASAPKAPAKSSKKKTPKKR